MIIKIQECKSCFLAKDIEKFVKQAKAGKPVDMNEVPPPVVSGASGPPAPAASEPPPAKGPQTDSNAAEVKPPPKPVSEVTPELPKGTVSCVVNFKKLLTSLLDHLTADMYLSCILVINATFVGNLILIRYYVYKM